MAKLSENLVLPTATGVYVALFTPREPLPGSGPNKKPRYQIILLYDKATAAKTLGPLMAAALRVAEAKWPGKGAAILKAMPYPVVRDGDKEYPDDPMFRGKYFVKASTEADPRRRPPQVVDARKQAVLDDEGAYSGCTFNVSVRLFPFGGEGKTYKPGVGVGLNNVQVVSRGTRLDGRKSAEEEFSEVDDGSSEPSGDGPGLI